MKKQTRYFRYCNWSEMNDALNEVGLPPYTSKASDIFIIEIKKENRIKKTLSKLIKRVSEWKGGMGI